MITNIQKVGKKAEVHWIIICQDRIVAKKQHGGWLLSSWSDLSMLHHYDDQILFIGEYGGKPCYAVDVGEENLALEEYETLSLRGIFLSNDEELFYAAARAWQLALFRRTHKYCGKCGSEMHQVDWELANHCHLCNHRSYPRVSPCVIVAIRKHNQILLAQGKAQKERNMYSILAGFVESGESLEQAVHREVFEEVGIKIKSLQYFGSQPWPFPHSLMMGFIAEHDSGDIKVDGREIIEADWYTKENLPFVPPNMSIAGKLIEYTLSLASQQE